MIRPGAYRKVAILGFAHAGEGFDAEQGWECWGINYPPEWAIEKGVNWARFYQLHPRDTIEPEEEAWAMQARCPVYVFAEHYRSYRVPGHRRVRVLKQYPLSRIKQLVLPQGQQPGVWRTEPRHDGMFASSFSYALAHAIYETKWTLTGPKRKPGVSGPLRWPTSTPSIFRNRDTRIKEIGLFGFGLTGGTPRERLVEYPCLLWWLGLAMGKGIKVTLPEKSELLWYPYDYGREYHEEVRWVNARLAAYGRVWEQSQQPVDPQSLREEESRGRQLLKTVETVPRKHYQRRDPPPGNR